MRKLAGANTKNVTKSKIFKLDNSPPSDMRDAISYLNMARKYKKIGNMYMALKATQTARKIIDYSIVKLGKNDKKYFTETF